MISSRLSLAIEESAFKVWYYIAKTFGENQSVNYAELDEFKDVELIYYDVRQLHYKVQQALLQGRAASRYYKVEAGNLLQSGSIITK